MKTYQVLETHQGDKLYVPNDPETGTRIADPNEVGHLVDLGLLKEIGDAPDAPVDEGADDDDTAARIGTLTTERDEARQQLDELRDQINARDDDLRDMTAQRDAALTERDAGATELADVRATLSIGSGSANEQRADDSAFDHDGDGKPGGSKPRSKPKAA